jgi:Protein of unknown function DUF262
MTYQTGQPIRELRFAQTGRMVEDLVLQMSKATMTADLPYQRGDVWAPGQRILLVNSLLDGTPVAALIINRRPERMRTSGGNVTGPSFAVIDGKQRLSTLVFLLTGQLAVPASWFPHSDVLATEDTADGPYVRWEGLAAKQQRRLADRQLAVEYASVGSVEEEAAIYLRINGYGTLQTADDIARAEGIAKSRL